MFNDVISTDNLLSMGLESVAEYNEVIEYCKTAMREAGATYEEIDECFERAQGNFEDWYADKPFKLNELMSNLAGAAFDGAISVIAEKCGLDEQQQDYITEESYFSDILSYNFALPEQNGFDKDYYCTGDITERATPMREAVKAYLIKEFEEHGGNTDDIPLYKDLQDKIGEYQVEAVCDGLYADLEYLSMVQAQELIKKYDIPVGKDDKEVKKDGIERE